MIQWMGVINLTPDSFYEPSRVASNNVPAILGRIGRMVDAGASIIDLGAVSTRPGADPVPLEEEWRRLEPVLRALGRMRMPDHSPFRVSVDTTRSEIVRRAFDTVGPFIVNDISAGEDDLQMLTAVAELGLSYVAMHKRGTPVNMDRQTDYPAGVVPELTLYFNAFARLADSVGISDWILDPGLGFAKTNAQNWQILSHLEALKQFGRPILAGCADKRFTHSIPKRVRKWFDSSDSDAPRRECRISDAGSASGTDIANALAVSHGASILRVHDIP